MRGGIQPRRDGDFCLNYDTQLCKRVVNNEEDVQVPDTYNGTITISFVFSPLCNLVQSRGFLP